ncbi:hypothetical protein [Piscinibacter sakaiensis]|uniref:Histidine kinase/HSP90-like ATPase domain-containing protein n=1 Tax=Piscinibacter sakaiensis TaxID=1547922 RepID=A0A0K8NX97_PISS1|nr:hypothetical protein [Piscinibacter sakaiensis]GAP35001.1 hypothetical protein ISF6_0566 [Piscinibacter sakaiensis]
MPVSEEAAQLVQALVLYAVAEAQAGHVTRIEVQADADRFAVADDGRGHSVDRRVGAVPYLTVVYEQFDFPFGQADPGPVQLQGIGLSLINRRCSELLVEVVRGGQRVVTTYRAGRQVAQQREPAPAAARSGTRIAGRVAGGAPPREDVARALCDWLAAVQAACPGVALVGPGGPGR